MRYIVALFVAAAATILLTGGVLLGAQLLEDDGEPTAEDLRIAQATNTPSPTPTERPTPSPTPTPFVVDATAGLAAARSEIESALSGIEGAWTLSVIDLPSGSELVFNEGQRLYPASAGKIVVAIAVLRKAQSGEVDFVPIQDRFEQMMIISSDEAADDMDALVSEAETQQVFRDAGASQTASFPGWRQGFVTAHDLALVWKALLEGSLLDDERTAYLLGLTARYEIDPVFETFPARLGREGYLYGQKAGYNIQNLPHTFVGAGYTVSADLRYGFVAVFMLHTELSAEASREQRTRVYPILVRHLLPPEQN